MAKSANKRINGETASLNPAVGIFGGTFNPVHCGHLHIALELKHLLDMAEMRMVPCAMPPHREPPGVTAQHRLAMLEMAIQQDPSTAAELIIDTCELQRVGPSYTIDTLELIRGQIGESTPLCLCMGMDSFKGLTSWHRWDELLDYAHIVVAARPGWRPPSAGRLAVLLKSRQTGLSSTMGETPGGSILLLETSLLPISATEIRQLLAQGLNVHNLLPDSVIDYIHQHGLYRQEPA